MLEVMCEHHFLARLRKMKETEKRLQDRERAIAKANIKYITSFNLLEENIRNAATQCTDRKRLEKLEEKNRNLRIILKNEEAVIEKCKQENAKLQKDYEFSISQTLKEMQKCEAYRERLHTLQHITNIHINAKALPDVVQGMVISDRQQERNWIPFQFSTKEMDKKQICEILWNLTLNSDTYNQQWEHLICGTQRSTE